MTTASWLRVGVCAIAVAGVVDPRMTWSRRPPLDVDVAVPGDGAVDAGAVQVVSELSRATAGDARLRVRRYAAGDRLPCAAEVPCVVVTNSTVAPRGGFNREAPLVTIASRATEMSDAVVVDDVRVDPVQVDDAATVQVTLSAAGAAGRTTVVEVRDDGVSTGRVSHTWSAQSPATLDVPWWPSRAGTRRLAVTVATARADGTTSPPSRVTAMADVSATPWPVLVIEARPSWASTFVRRALEADARFSVDAVAALAPGLATGRGAATLDDARVARARVVVVGGLDALTAGDVARLERFLRHRGGALVLVPDAALAGPIAALVPGRWQRRVEPQPSSAASTSEAAPATAVAALRASEWLRGSDPAAGDDVLATQGGVPVAVARPVGEGRVVMIGALDAWRFRLPAPADAPVPAPARPGRESNAYDAAWQGLAAYLARSTGDAVDVRVSHGSGDAMATIDVQARTMTPRSAWGASAQLLCGAAAEPLRLWPQARAGHFRGRVHWPPEGAVCNVVAVVADVGEGRATLSAPPPTPGETARVNARLAAIATGRGGLAAGPGDTAAVVRALSGLTRGAPAAASVWPLRAWWWGLVAAIALGAEWWLRRRAGAR